MKSTKSVSIEPEYTQLLSAYDNAQSVYDTAKKQEAKAKRTLKSADNNASKSEKQVLKLQLKQAKHLRKAQKSAADILELAVKKWIKAHVTEGSADITETPKKRGPKPKIKVQATEKTPKKQAHQPKIGKKSLEGAIKGIVDTTFEAVAVKKRSPKPENSKTVTEMAVETPSAKKRGRQPKVVEAMIAEIIAPVVPISPKKQGKVRELPRLEAEVEEGVSGVSAHAMEARATRGIGQPAAEPKRPRRTSEQVAAQKSALLDTANADVSGGDDFRILEGIGPKVTALLHKNGIKTFQNLADTSFDALKALMVSQRQYLSNPTNWARQAALAAAGDMAALEALKAALKNGK